MILSVYVLLDVTLTQRIGQPPRQPPLPWIVLTTTRVRLSLLVLISRHIALDLVAVYTILVKVLSVPPVLHT